MGKGRTILVVEDVAEIRMTLAHALETEGYRVYEAICGPEALMLLTTHRIDLVLSDIQMAGGDGLELLEKMRKAPTPMPPLAFITGHIGINPREAKERGAVALFSKPVELDHLLDWLKAYLTTVAR